MSIIGVVGQIGSGKSFTQMYEGVKFAEKYHKSIVANFKIDIGALERYASSPRILDSWFGKILYHLLLELYQFRVSLARCYPAVFLPPRKLRFKPRLPWVAHLCRTGGISCMPNPEHIEALLIPESVVLLDEAGILLNSRQFAKTSKQLLADLAQSRKDGTDVIWCSQFADQVDKQFRELTQFWIHCQSLTKFSRRLRRPQLIFKSFYWFQAAAYKSWIGNHRAQRSPMRTRFGYAFDCTTAFITPSDLMLFDCYDSFSRLDIGIAGGTFIHTRAKCELPRDYYWHHRPTMSALPRNYYQSRPRTVKHWAGGQQIEIQLSGELRFAVVPKQATSELDWLVVS